VLEGFVHGVLGDLQGEHPVTEVLVPRSVTEHLEPFAKTPQLAFDHLQRVGLGYSHDPWTLSCM
jgi:hypothetical protein